MGRAKEKANAGSDAAAARARGWAVRGLALALGLGLLLALLLAVSRAARERLRQDARYTTTFAAIDCQPPPPVPRAEFLAEVQYLADMPDQLYHLDEGLARRLAEVFARHPWVARVERVAVVSGRPVQVRLAFLTPVLAVVLDGRKRAVDREGVLLPAKAVTDGLPVFAGRVVAPAGPAGTRWGDAAIEQAARAAGHEKP
jgi:hypothetical protein